MKLAKTLAIWMLCCILSIPIYSQLNNDCNAGGAIGDNLLNNGSFEDGTLGFVGGGSGMDSWQSFGNIFLLESPDGYCQPVPTVAAPGNGKNFVKMFGTFSGVSVLIGPAMEAEAGETYVASVDMYSPKEEECNGVMFSDHIPEGNPNFGIVQIQYLDGGGVVLGFSESKQFDYKYAAGRWTEMSTIGVIPDGAASVRIVVLFIQPGFDGGAIYYDDAKLALKAEGVSTTNLACNDHVNVTLNSDCASDITGDMFIEGDYDDLTLDFEITNNIGAQIDPEFPIFNQTLNYSVIDICSGNSCWGTVLFEDKEDPTIDCEICPEINGSSVLDYSDDCILACYEQPILQLRYDDRLRDDLVMEDYEDFADDAMSDNCDNWDPEDVSFYDDYQSLGACVGTRLKRTWTVGFTRNDGTRGTVSCTREYFFAPVDLSTAREYDVDPLTGQYIIEPIEDTLVLPPASISLPCGVDVSPEGIAAFFDNPLTVDRDTDDNGIDPDELDVDLVVENNEGYAWGYPHYYQDGVGSGGPHAQKIDNEVCNLISGYTDQEIDACAPGCGGNRKILRSWVVLDWCTGQFAEYGQIIKSQDTQGPQLSVPNTSASVDPWNCTAAVNLPAPEHIGDDCDSDVTYYIGNTGGYSVSGNATDGFVLHGVELGTHTIEYLSEDCCGNIGRATMQVTVVDQTGPVAVSKEFIVISLTNVGNTVDEFQGFAKIYAEDIDNGSYDGCTGVSLEVRRTPVCDAADAQWGPFVTFCCEDLQGGGSAEINVELKIEDEYGNANIVWATVLLEDKSGTIPVIPPHMFLTCDMDYNDFSITGG
ncbi:MAG: hypothetical protein KJN84_14455, partial [Bacteroidia bacterium]|nr:hypothetical protein [Bacteroidia bacterium]